MAASVSYYTVLSLFPLILALTAITGWVVGSQIRQDELVEYVVGNLPGSEQFVQDSYDPVQTPENVAPLPSNYPVNLPQRCNRPGLALIPAPVRDRSGLFGTGFPDESTYR